MNKDELKAKLTLAETLDDVKSILCDYPKPEAEAIYRELESHREKKREIRHRRA